MPQSGRDWLDLQLEREFTRQRARVDTAKLVTTFATGIAGALVASALQTDRGTPLNVWSAVFLA
jgi:hypothetical protein